MHIKYEGVELAIEVKSTKLSRKQEQINEIGNSIYQTIADHFSKQISQLDIEFTHEFSQKSLSKKGVDELLSDTTELTNDLIQVIQQSIDTKSWGSNTYSNIIRYSIQAPIESKNRGSFVGLCYNPIFEAEHICDIIRKKPDQLPTHCPTLYIIRIETVSHFNKNVEPIFLRKLWDNSKFNHVGGVLILDKTMYVKNYRTSFAYIPNHYCKIRVSQEKIFKIFVKDILRIEKSIK